MVTDLNSALLDAFTVAGQKFVWNGQFYSCIANAERGSLVTAKTIFGTYGYPRQGDIITVANRDWTIIKLANATIEITVGGLVPDGPFIDDPTNPSLAIFFEPFIRK